NELPTSIEYLSRANEVEHSGASAVEATHDQHDRVKDGIDPGQLRAPYEGQRAATRQTGGVHKLVGRRDARGSQVDPGRDLSQLASDLALCGVGIHPRRARG